MTDRENRRRRDAEEDAESRGIVSSEGSKNCLWHDSSFGALYLSVHDGPPEPRDSSTSPRSLHCSNRYCPY